MSIIDRLRRWLAAERARRAEAVAAYEAQHEASRRVDALRAEGGDTATRMLWRDR